VATFVYFVLDGTLMGMWLVQIPAVEKRVAVSNATLGSLLVLLGLGALIGGRAASAGISPAATLGAAGAVGIVVALLPARSLLAATRGPPPSPTAPSRRP
jgi:hypothetical protein